MLPRLPLVWRKQVARRFKRLVFKRGRQAIIPAVEKAEHADHGHDFGLLAFVKMHIQCSEMFVGGGVGDLSRSKGKVERCAFCCGEYLQAIAGPVPWYIVCASR